MKRPSLLLFWAVFATLIGSQAHSQTIFSDNFAGENGGATELSYTNFTNFSVVYGSVDLLHTGDGFGVNCGSSSACINLGGSTETGGTLLSNPFNFSANQLVTFTVDVSGNQTSEAAALDDDLGIGFTTLGVSEVNFASVTGFGVVPNAPSFPQDPSGDGFGFTSDNTIPFNQNFQEYSITFSAAQAGIGQAYIYTDSVDSTGPILNDATLTVSATPEPSSWLLMIGGCGGVGLMLRRAKKATSARSEGPLFV
jgi:hypothetical protein